MVGDLTDAPAASPPAVAMRRQRIVRTRRQYNQWVNNETLEDYALRFTAQKARRWSPIWVANTALGSIAFLACEAIGATVTINYGFSNAVLALAVAGVIFLLAGLPICYYGARYGVDMDLLTRGAGFGYLGSTITSAVYASFTFILFAIEAVILSAALELCFGIPLAIGHVISALLVLPIAAYGFRRISWLQNWTQPAWLLLQVVPLVYIFGQGEAAIDLWTGFEGTHQTGAPDMLRFGIALAVLLSLLPQIGEQVDYLRFLPAREKTGRTQWWSALLFTGPGWILFGGLKILIGSCLAVLLLKSGASASDAANPTMLYHGVFGAIFGSPFAAIVLTGLFVAVCQVKINVTNAYAGSIASSNFFSRLTHRHPGRVVWLVFNIGIALMLMEGGIENVVENVLALYSQFAVAWFGAVTADLIVNKPLGLSPPGIEFKRAHLYDINPVGVGAMLASLIASMLCFTGLFGPTAQVFSPVVGLVISFAAAPLIAWATGGRYYLARSGTAGTCSEADCTVCENSFEAPDMAHCPVYDGAICSLCCTLEARCHDACKPQARVSDQSARLLARLMPGMTGSGFGPIFRFLLLFAAVSGAVGVMMFAVYLQQTGTGAPPASLASAFRVVFACLLVLAAFVAWYFVLTQESQHAAEGESDRQTVMLMDEIEAHRQTDAALQRAKDVAEAANLAKSRYIAGVSHEIRSPLNTISGYAQLLERDPTRHVGDAVRVIRRSASHLANLVDGLVDISRIENGSLRIERNRVNLIDMLDQIVDMFRLQAAAKGLVFEYDRARHLPLYVHTDEKRLQQILINLISNAIKYTHSGSAALTVLWRNPVAEFEISDTGVGIAPENLERIFEPFERLPGSTSPGIGLGLTITRLLSEIMGGSLTVESTPGAGSTFRLKLFLSEAEAPHRAIGRGRPLGYEGQRRLILVADDDPEHRDMVRDLLAPLGFDLAFAADGRSCLENYAARAADLVMLDIAMPVMNGWEAGRQLRAQFGDEPLILMVSANVHDFRRSRHPDDPHDDFLAKPYEIDDLLDRIGTLLALKWTFPQVHA